MFAVLQFPGSNDDRDTLFAMKTVLGAETELVWHGASALPAGTRAVLLPGGFSYGDYLRAGAMARFSPILAAVQRFAADGGPVLGICNGFQVLCESGLLPGVLRRNRDLHFICETACLRVEHSRAPFSSRVAAGSILRVPIKHGEGAYYADAAELDRMEERGQVLLRYCAADGAVTDAANPNGTQRNIAGVTNERGNVLGLMPHPEHAVEAATGGTDGLAILGSLLDAVAPR